MEYFKNLKEIIVMTFSWFIVQYAAGENSTAGCEFPTLPFGVKVNVNKDVYQVGDTVHFSCNKNFKILGSVNSTCKETGSWEKPLPLCLKKIMFNGIPHSSPKNTNFPASLAVDGNYASCTKINNSGHDSHSWWIELDKEYDIDYVELVTNTGKMEKFSVSIKIRSISPKKDYECEKLDNLPANSKINRTILCNNSGSVVRIVDIENLEICEITLYQIVSSCDKPNISPNCEVTIYWDNEVQYAKYYGKVGYEIASNAVTVRTCVNGIWKGDIPLCIASNQKKSNYSVPMIGIAIGLTVGSLFTIIVTVVIVIFLRKCCKKTELTSVKRNDEKLSYPISKARDEKNLFQNNTYTDKIQSRESFLHPPKPINSKQQEQAQIRSDSVSSHEYSQIGENIESIYELEAVYETIEK